MITNLHTTIFLICGLSGSGKDTFAKFLACNEDLKHGTPAVRLITSYTTRPMRVGETQGKEHMFVSEFQHKYGSDIMAYCKYGDAEYWTYTSQFRSLPYCVYVVDEASLIFLREKARSIGISEFRKIGISEGRKWSFSVKTILVRRDNIDVGIERTSRDTERDFSNIEFDYIIDNNSSLDDLKTKATKIRKEVFASDKKNRKVESSEN